MKNLTQKRIVYFVVLLVAFTSFYQLWKLDKLLKEQSEWCFAQEEAYPLNACGGIAERDLSRTYYLKILMFSILVYGSTSLVVLVNKKEA